MSVLSHKYIIQLYGAVVAALCYRLKMEYAKQDSLYDYTADKKLDFENVGSL